MTAREGRQEACECRAPAGGDGARAYVSRSILRSENPVAWAYPVHPSGFFVSPPQGVASCVPAFLAAVHLLLARRYAAAAAMLRLVPVSETPTPAVFSAIRDIRGIALAPSHGAADAHPDALGVRLQMVAAAVRACGARDSASLQRACVDGEERGPGTNPLLYAALSAGDGDPGNFAARALYELADTWEDLFAKDYASYLGSLAHVRPECLLAEDEEAIVLAAVSATVSKSVFGRGLAVNGAVAPYESTLASLLPGPLRARDAYLAGLLVSGEVQMAGQPVYPSAVLCAPHAESAHRARRKSCGCYPALALSPWRRLRLACSQGGSMRRG